MASTIPDLLQTTGGMTPPQRWNPNLTNTTGYNGGLGNWELYDGKEEAIKLTGTTGTIASTNTQTQITVSLGTLTALSTPQSASLLLANDGTGVTITKAELQFTETVGSQTITISYNLPEVIGTYQIAGATATYATFDNNTSVQSAINLPQGVRANAQLVLTFASAPVAGSVSASVVLRDRPLRGALPKRLLMTIPYATFTSQAQAYLRTIHLDAKNITFLVINTMDQPTGNWYFSTTDFDITSTTGNSSGSQEPTTAIGANSEYYYSYNTTMTPDITHGVGLAGLDTIQHKIFAPTTAPTKGQVQVYLVEVL